MTVTNTSSTTSEKKIDPRQVFVYAKDEKTVFLLADIALGTSALWLPLLLGAFFSTKTSIWNELIKLLDAGSGYTFALPFLAASISFLYLERKKENVNELRENLAPDILTQSLGLIIIGLILTGIHFTASILDKNAGGFVLNFIQFVFVTITILKGSELFCLKNIDRVPDVKRYLLEEKKKATEILNQAKNSDSF